MSDINRLPAIRAKALAMAASTNSPRYAQVLRHIALDCEHAMHGCKASAESVAEFVAADDWLATASEATIPAIGVAA